MNKLSIFISALATAGAMVSCSEEHIKMPWEDDLNAKHEEQKGELPDASIGQVLPRWAEGCFDIHLINSGRGECIFYIMPDGTTLLIDAGEIATDKTKSVPQKPNASTRPYMVDATYIRHFLPAGKKAFDYFLASHFHTDHIGAPGMATETAEGGYKLAGITAVYSEIPFNHLIDRGYPSYKEDPALPPIESGFADDYVKFVKWGISNKKFDGARFEVGKNQIKMLNAAEKYKNFSIFNICGNGSVWVVDDASTAGGKVESFNKNGANPASCGVHIRYGKFDYIACGDLVSSPQNAVANYVKAVIPINGFEVFKAHHHLSANSWGSGMQKNAFAPRIIVNQNFTDYQPDYALLSSINTGVFDNNTYTWEKNFFTTNLHPNHEQTYPDIASKLAGYNGHIVVRVAPGGDSYYVYMLDDTDMIYRVKSIHGPYKSK